MPDSRLFAPAVARNRDPILDVLRKILPSKGVVLEIASGSGEHVAHFAAALPGLTFQPSDPNPEARASIDAWIAQTGLPNIRPAVALDASQSALAPVLGRCDPVHQHGPYLALGGDRGPVPPGL